MKGTPLYQRIYLEILNDIKSGKYPLGMRLPSEKELCSIYNVSRITGKKAMDMLAEKNVISRMPGKGSFVNEAWAEVVEMLPLSEPNKENIIGVVMDGFGGSFGYQLILGIEKTCRQYGYHMVLHCTNGSKEEESKAVGSLISLGAKGLIIMCVHSENYNSTILKLAIEEYPVVLLDRCLKGVPVSFVGTDNIKAAKELTNWLLVRGHQNICFASHCGVDTPTIADRQTGFVESHLEHGLSTNESMWLTNLKSTLPSHRTESSLKEDFENVKDFIKSHPEITAFFAVEFEIARIIRSAIAKLGISDKYTIVCFDGYESIVEEEEFTHVCQDEISMGRMSVEILKEKFEGIKKIEPVLVPYKIVDCNEWSGL